MKIKKLVLIGAIALVSIACLSGAVCADTKFVNQSILDLDDLEMDENFNIMSSLFGNGYDDSYDCNNSYNCKRSYARCDYDDYDYAPYYTRDYARDYTSDNSPEVHVYAFKVNVTPEGITWSEIDNAEEDYGWIPIEDVISYDAPTQQIIPAQKIMSVDEIPLEDMNMFQLFSALADVIGESDVAEEPTDYRWSDDCQNGHCCIPSFLRD